MDHEVDGVNGSLVCWLLVCNQWSISMNVCVYCPSNGMRWQILEKRMQVEWMEGWMDG